MSLVSNKWWLLFAALLLSEGVAFVGCSDKSNPGPNTVKEGPKNKPDPANPADRRPGDPVALTVDKDHTPPRETQPVKVPEVSPPLVTPPLFTPPAKTPDEVPKDDEANKPKPLLTDPVLFKDWPTPKAVLVFSGEQHGYLEPCGCAGFDNMKGGLTRRHTFIKELQAKGWPVAGLDVGGQLNPRRHGAQGSLQFGGTIDSLKGMGYQVIGMGTTELLLSETELVALTSGGNGVKSPFIAANVGIFGFDETRVPFFRVLEIGGMKIGVTSVIGDKELKEVTAANIEHQPAAGALEKNVLPKLREAKCDRLILLAYATPAEAKELGKQFSDFQLVVCAGPATGAEPPAVAEQIVDTNSQLVEVGHKGSHVVAIGLFDDQQTPFRYQRVPMDSRFKESPEMIQIKAAMQQQLEVLEKAGENPEIKPQPHPANGSFVGSAACAECHEAATTVFNQTPHAKAFDTLANLNPPRIHDPECLSCHVTGWNPQEFFPYASGFLNKEKTPSLLHNGCENCHGPGKAHVDAENNEKSSDKLKADLRTLMSLPLEAEKNRNRCAECHDGDNSPKFQVDFLQYWKKIEHHGKN